jgi:7-cyano-7-deazaguanine synthase
MKNIILLSGGLDSTSLLYYLLKDKEKTDIIAVFFDYGQKSLVKEREAAETITKKAGVKLISINLTDVFGWSQSSLLKHNKKPVTEIKKYGKHTRFISKNTEVEFRNGVFISNAISLAMQRYPDEKATVYYGATKGRENYKDCSVIFVEYYKLLAKYVSNELIDVQAPFICMGKDEVVRIAKLLNVTIEKTWSCYEGKEKPCGICPQCLDRKILGVFYDNKQG